MSAKLNRFSPVTEMSLVLEQQDFAVRGASQKAKSIFMWSKLNTIHTSLCLMFIHATPLRLGNFFPNFDEAVVSACGYQTFEFWVRPSDLPAWSQMCSLNSYLSFLQKCNTLLIDLIALHLRDPYRSLRVARSDPCSEEVKLGVILNKSNQSN